ncbi:MAG: hypothetical protein JW871_04835 [Endomicrobiales bacterium]|nr:hypothetical protein [Endomicrobiales bacterium]
MLRFLIIRIIFRTLIFIAFLSIPTFLNAYTLFYKDYGTYAYDAEFDPYYSYLEIYTSLTKKPLPYLKEEDESEIYKYLWKRSFIPRFLLLEISCYPFPMLGVAVKKNYNGFYNNMSVSDDLNLIESMCAGFEEPTAFSFFLGNLVSFQPKGVSKDIKGKAYMGYLASIGSFHIKNSELIEDKWFELEWKIKGDKITEKRTISWSYRIGTKQHDHSDIKDVLYFSIFRDRVDFKEQKKSIFNNASFEYKIDIDYKELQAITHFLLIGKSFPHKTKKFAFQIKFGFLLEKGEKYTGALKNLETEDNLYFMIRPNIKF